MALAVKNNFLHTSMYYLALFFFLDILAVRFLIVIIYLPLPFPKGYRFEKGHSMPSVYSH